jgi:pyruvate/2-oxoglutarate dehydrogenase complex dihydrolipoamide acyltransferase (E2) component
MKRSFAILAAGLIASSTVLAQLPAGAPAGSTGLCKDGSYTSNDSKKGACSGHKGVKEWYANSAAPAAAKAAAPTPAPATAATTAPAPVKAASPAKKTAATEPSVAQAPGGGPGQVWVNKNSKVYHCPGTKYYGKTKQGEYMTEAAAKAAGNHSDHGKSCS